MQTSQQQTVGPDAGTRAVTSELADIARADGRRFAELVRQADQLMAGGMERDAAYRRALYGPAVRSPTG